MRLRATNLIFLSMLAIGCSGQQRGDKSQSGDEFCWRDWISGDLESLTLIGEDAFLAGEDIFYLDQNGYLWLNGVFVSVAKKKTFHPSGVVITRGAQKGTYEWDGLDVVLKQCEGAVNLVGSPEIEYGYYVSLMRRLALAPGVEGLDLVVVTCEPKVLPLSTKRLYPAAAKELTENIRIVYAKRGEMGHAEYATKVGEDWRITRDVVELSDLLLGIDPANRLIHVFPNNDMNIKSVMSLCLALRDAGFSNILLD